MLKPFTPALDTICDLYVQVIEGGDLDINFVISDPDKVAMVMEPRSMDGLHGLDVKKTGEYEICLDNSFSSFTGKCAQQDMLHGQLMDYTYM